MNYRQTIYVKNYLNKYDEILTKMATNMLSASTNNNVTTNFIKSIIPCYEASINICKNFIQYTRFETLQKITNDIIETQTKIIKKLSEFENITYNFYNMNYEYEKYMLEYKKLADEMIYKMKNYTRYMNIHFNFLEEICIYNEETAKICKNVLQYRIDARLKVVLEEIIENQEIKNKQLKEIKKYLSRRYY